MAHTDSLATATVTPEHAHEGASAAGRMLRLLGQVAFHVLLLAVAFIALFPIVWMLVGSIQTVQELYRGVTFWPAVPQFQNYVVAWTKGGFSVYLPNSVFYSAVCVLAILLVASMAGYALARIEFPGRGVVLFLVMAIIIVPLPATFIALYKLLVDIGLANTRTGYIVALVAGGLPISIFILRGFFMRQPKELEDAAILDGCNAFDVFWRVMLPLARPGLAAVAVIEFLRIWNEYLLALVMFNSEMLMPVQRGLTKFVSSDTPEQHILLAATAMAVLPVIILYTVAQKSIIQGIMEGAVKA
ncbi:MAG: carbohydrate ABC transporter permease [Chloroflexi bacterium]|nr:carbohydrate ABC transporter permease [Chloroflexota bacterium]